MTFISNEKLAAFSDGELDENEAALVGQALANDELLRARLARLMSVDDQLRAAFDVVDDGAVPYGLARLLEPDKVQEQAPPRPRPSVYGRVRRWLPAGAAVAAGVAGLVVGGMLPAQGDEAWLKPRGAALALAGPAQAGADHTPSGSRYVAGPLAVQPIVSFKAGDGRLCREMQIEGPQVAAHAVACREGGEWRVEALVRTPTHGATTGYRPAGAVRDPAIEAVHARLQIDSVLDAALEDAAIAGGWQAK